MKPTEELYQALQVAYAHFNRTLFDEELPNVIFTVQRQKSTLGYFAPDRWSSLSGDRCHEIAINPVHMGESRLIEVLQTLVHEMVHCWQHCFGTQTQGNTCYHNKEWANKMIEVGLQPTSTGLPGGAITGQQMSDYPIKDGVFMQSCYRLVNEQSFNIPWIDRRTAPKSEMLENAASQIPDHFESQEQIPFDDASISELLTTSYSDLMPEDTFIMQTPQKVRSKQKYQCPVCFTNVWGKSDLYIICGGCDARFEEI